MTTVCSGSVNKVNILQIWAPVDFLPGNVWLAIAMFSILCQINISRTNFKVPIVVFFIFWFVARMGGMW